MKEFAEHLLEETIYELTSLKDSFEDGLLNTSFSKRGIKRVKERKSKGKKKYGYK